VATLATAIAVPQPNVWKVALIDDALAVDLFELHPHAQHIPTIFAPDGAHRIGAVKLAQVLWGA
jgi:hypothetical protein